MHKSATKCNETLGKWCKNKHGASKIIHTLETYQASPLPTPCPSPPRPASRGGRRRNMAAQSQGSSTAEPLHPRPPWPANEVDRPVSASLCRRSSLQRAGATGSLPIPPPRRHREGSFLPRPRSPDPPQPSLLTKLRSDPALDAALHGRRREKGSHRWPAPPKDAGEELLGRTPNTPKKAPNLLAVQGGRPPLSQALRPARPPEARERGTAGSMGPLKGGHGGARGERGEL
jgi:hypothetical protein